jgi:hypothetical protein
VALATVHVDPRGWSVLRDDGGALVLTVLVGGFAAYEVAVRLSPEEALAFRDDVHALDRLAREVAEGAHPRAIAWP